MMKKVLSLLLAILMLVSMCAFADAVVEEGAFPDVAGDHANAEAIKHYAEAGVINGYPDGTFGPDKPITRGEFVKMLMVYAGNEKANTEGVVTGFPDVDGAEGKEAHWAHPYIKTAVDLKIVNGYPDGTFKPDDNVKYEEALKMMVCYLNGEDAAKDKVKGTTYDVYPEGYIRVANEKLMNRNLASSLGTQASRADVAQILFNSKEIKTLKPTTVIPSFGGGGGGGGGGGDVVTYTLDQSISMGRNWSGLYDGVVVAATKLNSLDRKEQYIIDGDGEGLVVRNGSKTYYCSTISTRQIIVKLDVPILGSSYILLTSQTQNRSYYDYLGHHVAVTFTYNGDDDAFYLNALGDLQEAETKGSISSSAILKEKTDIYNASATQDYGIVYYDAKEDEEVTIKLPRDLNSLKVIYNDKLVDTSQTPLTIDDFIPGSGTISYVKANRNDYRLIRIRNVDTYVVGRIYANTTPRRISDKYRKEADEISPLMLTLDEENANVTLVIKNTAGKEMKVADLRKGNVLTVTASKCGTYVNVSVYVGDTNKSQKIVGLSDEEGIAFEGNKTKYYPYSSYYKKYVKNTLDIEHSDHVVACINAAGEIVWLEETEPVYRIGYLKWAVINTSDNIITATIINSGSTPTEGTYTINNLTKVGTPSVEDGTYISGEKRKYSDMQQLFDLLKSKAAAINSDKTNGNTNADFAQPIRYVVSGNNIEILETMALDTPNKFKSAKFTYTEDEGKKFEGEINGQTVAFSAGASDITYIFVPNDRKSHAANIYKMGTFSQVSPTNNPKIIPYGKYNIEPYFVPNANGGFDRKVFVIYNENIDAQPNYRSETIVVEKREQKENSGAYVWTITPKSGYGNSKSSYNTVSLSSINAFVLDANFERMRDEHGNYIKREVMPGDVIRFGHAPGGAIMNLEILYDISEDLENRKEITYDNTGSMVDYSNFPFKALINYYGRVGLITYVPDNPDSCKLSVGVGEESNLFLDNYSSQKVLLNTYKNDGTCNWEVKTMDDLYPGDMVYVWQYYSSGLKVKYIYAVRYETDLMSQYDAENAPSPEPGEGEDPVQPGQGGGENNESGTGEEPVQPGEGSGENNESGTGEEPSEPGTGEDPVDPGNGGNTETGEGGGESAEPGTGGETSNSDNGGETTDPDNGENGELDQPGLENE